jgi:hypothetical protein
MALSSPLLGAADPQKVPRRLGPVAAMPGDDAGKLRRQPLIEE